MSSDEASQPNIKPILIKLLYAFRRPTRSSFIIIIINNLILATFLLSCNAYFTLSIHIPLIGYFCVFVDKFKAKSRLLFVQVKKKAKSKQSYHSVSTKLCIKNWHWKKLDSVLGQWPFIISQLLIAYSSAHSMIEEYIFICLCMDIFV